LVGETGKKPKRERETKKTEKRRDTKIPDKLLSVF
jgi:hypothetical protein